MSSVKYDYIHPPIDLIIAQNTLNEKRPATDNIPGNREYKRIVYANVRNMCMKHGMRCMEYFGLVGKYPDDIAISLYPIISSMIGIEKDKTYNDINDFANEFSKLSGFPITMINDDFFSTDPGNARIIDGDLNTIMNESTMEKMTDLVCRAKQNLIAFMVWCSYGMKVITEEKQIEILDILEDELSYEFNIKDSYKYNYIGNHIPILHRSYILERKKK